LGGNPSETFQPYGTFGFTAAEHAQEQSSKKKEREVSIVLSATHPILQYSIDHETNLVSWWSMNSLGC
jgi:hypothetical protein